MRDTSDIDDRVASKYYSHLFNETMLPRRFPIGKEKIVVSPPLSAPPSNPPCPNSALSPISMEDDLLPSADCSDAT